MTINDKEWAESGLYGRIARKTSIGKVLFEDRWMTKEEFGALFGITAAKVAYYMNKCDWDVDMFDKKMGRVKDEK